MKSDHRFKIDLNAWGYINVYSLYVRQEEGLIFKSENWKEIKSFETREKAREYYEKVKDLPEYLK